MPDANEREDRAIRAAYVTPGHPVAFSTPTRVANHFGISRPRAKKLLEHIEGYTLHREYKKPRVYNPYYVHGRREQVQGDLIDISSISAHNNGVKFLLLLIDIFTKKIWVYPLKNKTAASVSRALARWLASLRVIPDKLMTDQGLEFKNRPVQNLLQRRGVEWQPAYGTLKAAIAERANKSLQVLIYKYLTEKETLRYVNKLTALVSTYNKRGHRTLEGMSPLEADKPRNENHVRAVFHQRYADIARHRKSSLPFRVGDLVRLKTLAKKAISSSARAYAEQFHGEYYRIVRINRTLPIALYYLKSLDTGERIDGGLYANELQRQRGNLWKIERVLARRTRRGVRQIKVKWKYFSDRWNEWIPEANVQRVF